MQIQEYRIKPLRGLLADIARSKLGFSMATACLKLLTQMQETNLLEAVPAGGGYALPCVCWHLDCCACWSADMGFASLRNAVFNAVDVSYEQPPSPPTTTGARASTNMPHAHASCPCLLLAAFCWFAGCVDCEFTISFTGCP